MVNVFNGLSAIFLRIDLEEKNAIYAVPVRGANTKFQGPTNHGVLHSLVPPRELVELDIRYRSSVDRAASVAGFAWHRRISTTVNYPKQNTQRLRSD